jgi:hypothetical protein
MKLSEALAKLVAAMDRAGAPAEIIPFSRTA